MPRKGSNAAIAGEETGPPRRSSRIASQPKLEEVVPAAKPRATKKRSADEGSGAGAGAGAGGEAKEEGEGAAVAKKAKSDNGSAGVADGVAAAAATANDNMVVDEGDRPPSPIVLAPVEVGDSLPSVVLKNEKDEDVEIARIADEKGVVMFLVPKADTSGCTTQACGFRDIYPDFTQYGYTVYCLSADSSKTQNNWQTKKALPYTLISDPKRILITALGAGEGGKTKRSHFVFEKGGKLLEKRMPVTPAESANLALEYIKGITPAEAAPES